MLFIYIERTGGAFTCQREQRVAVEDRDRTLTQLKSNSFSLR